LLRKTYCRREHSSCQSANTLAAHLQAPLALARTLMAGSLDIRDSFDDLGGPDLVVELHKQHIGDVDLQVNSSVVSCEIQ
jgi:hypothetical protein